MIRKLTLAAGFGAGYVLGAKAGTQRYEQIVAKAREVAGMPAVQEVTSNLTSTASSVADTAKSTVNEKISSVAGSGSSTGSTGTTPPPVVTTPPPVASTTTTGTVPTVDLTEGTSSSGYATGAAPMAGANASDTV